LELWDRPALAVRIARIRQGERSQYIHSTAEVFLKIYNTDLMLR